MRELVDSHPHRAWTRAAADLLPPEALPAEQSNVGEWLTAIR